MAVRIFPIFLLCAAAICCAGACTAGSALCRPKSADANSVEMILRQLNEKAAGLRSYQCRIEYLFSQPILESKTLRRGELYYQRADGRSALRINFQTLKQDDQKEQKYIEQYIFDGVRLTHIDYQIREVKRYQLAEPNEPADAFDLARGNFPLIGFSRAEDLTKDFEIKPVETAGRQKQDFIRLNLKVKPDSIYKDDYTSIDFWIDKKLCLPAKITAVSTEEDIYEIRLLEPKVDERIDSKVFEFAVPEGFGEEIVPKKDLGRKAGAG